MRRTGHEGLHSRVIKMDLKDLVNELEEKEAQELAALACGNDLSQPCHKSLDGKRAAKSVRCCGKYTKCNSNCRKESAAELCARLGFEEPSEDQKRQNLSENLDYFFSQVRK